MPFGVCLPGPWHASVVDSPDIADSSSLLDTYILLVKDDLSEKTNTSRGNLFRGQLPAATVLLPSPWRSQCYPHFIVFVRQRSILAGFQRLTSLFSTEATRSYRWMSSSARQRNPPDPRPLSTNLSLHKI